MARSTKILASDTRFSFAGFLGTPKTVVGVRETAFPIIVDECWSEGSQSVFVFLDITSGREIPFTKTRSPFSAKAPDVDLKPGMACVERSTFHGKPGSTSIMLHPDDYTRLIEDQCPPCTAHEECRKNPDTIGLACAQENKGRSAFNERTKSILDTFGLKSGPYRQEAQNALKIEPAEIDTLISEGLLKRAKNGAMSLTPAGKIARGSAI